MAQIRMTLRDLKGHQLLHMNRKAYEL